jgi:hypothetical protein
MRAFYLVSPSFNYRAVLHHIDIVSPIEDVQSMGDQYSSPRCKRSIEKAVVKDESPNMGVHSRQWVVEENNIRGRVRSASEGDASLRGDT